jgi:hypothetical protein
MKVLAFILDCNVDPADPTGTCRFNVSYTVSTGTLSSSISALITISDTEAAITADIKQAVADEVNTQLGTSILKGAVRLF